jgi:hypothetical protein
LILIHDQGTKAQGLQSFSGKPRFICCLECVANIRCTKTGSSEVSSIAMTSLAILIEKVLVGEYLVGKLNKQKGRHPQHTYVTDCHFHTK